MDKSVEDVAVRLTGTIGQEVLLSIVRIEGPSTAEDEAKKIIASLNENNIKTEKKWYTCV